VARPGRPALRINVEPNENWRKSNGEALRNINDLNKINVGMQRCFYAITMPSVEEYMATDRTHIGGRSGQA
jgi:hypothetical protein